MFRKLAAQALVAMTAALTLGVGCGSTGGGCSSLQPLPKDSMGNFSPAPLGLPSGQVIEGGFQARITKPGMDKLLATIPSLFGPLINNICIPPVSQQIGPTCFSVTVGACGSNNCMGGKSPGCPANIQLSSSDMKDGITATLSEGNNPIIHVDAKFDIDVPLEIDYKGELVCLSASGMCTMDTRSQHYMSGNGAPVEFSADIQTGIDPTTGELTLHLAGMQVLNLGLQVGGNCFSGIVGSLVQDLINALLDLLNTQIGQAITDLILKLIQPQLDALVQSFLPKPLGLAGTMNTGALLGSFNPPKDANMEMFIVPGGYVQGKDVGKGTGLTLGVMTGANSDRDQTTRTPMLVSEPNLCVPARMVPNVGGAPWNLPFNAARKDFTLSPAGPFSGNPEPTDAMGNLQDVAIGISRTYLNLLGFHFYSSGSLCLQINGSAIPQLNAGTLSLIIQSLGNIVEDKKAPLQLVVRPQTPILFTIGAGTMADPLLHIGITDLRIDFYGWLEERWARILTLAVDLNIGLNLTVTKDANGKAAIQPMLMGVNAQNVTIRVSNTDLLQETPDALAKVFPSLINIVTNALGGALGKPVTLPAVAGFSLTDFSISRVQTSQDDFIGIFANLTTGGPAPIVDWGNPFAPDAVGVVRTHAELGEVVAPRPAELRALFEPSPVLAIQGKRPTVQLHLGADHANGRPVEWSWRIDGGLYHPWTQEPNPIVADDAFLLQGHHKIEVRSRALGDWATEDTQPVVIDALIDSVAPELHPARDPEGAKRILFNGSDLVTPDDKLLYAWMGADGKRTEWSNTSALDAAQLSAISDGFRNQVTLFAKDEAGNVGQTLFDAGVMLDIAPAPKAAGGCSIVMTGDDGSARGATLLALALMALVFLRRRSTAKALASLIAVVALGVFVAGCGCQNKNQCSVDEDCAKMQCPAGQIPTCANNMCQCVPDMYIGDIGRFSSMTMIAGESFVSAYNNTYGDLMIGHIVPPGVVGNWDFVDGVPSDVAPEMPTSHVRGGVQDPGDDVGRYTSIASSKDGQPIVVYYDKTHGSLKFASFGVVRWRTHVIDQGGLMEGMGTGDDVGRWTSMTLDADGKPAIAYSAFVQKGVSGMPESQLRWAQANVPNPQQTSDWTITVLDSRVAGTANPMDMGMPMIDMAGPVADMAAGDGGAAMPPATPDQLLPPGVALMASAARDMMDLPSVVYYDYERGNLRYTAFNPNMGKWSVPVVLDGEDGKGNDTGDVGRYPSITFDANNLGHIAYESGPQDKLYYMNTKDRTRIVVDDGYHKDEMTQDGLPSPVWHFVGDSSSIVILQSGLPSVAYQDSTVLQLRLATMQKDGSWQKQYIAGHASPFKGSYGFYANMKNEGGNGVLSTYAINQQLDQPIYFVEVFALDFGAIE